jgi:hypothetical protein
MVHGGTARAVDEPTSSDQVGGVFAFSSHMTHQLHTPNNPALQKDPDEWKTGDEPMTAAQRSYLETLAQDTGEQFDDTLTKAEASRMIDDLRQKSPRLSGEDLT